MSYITKIQNKYIIIMNVFSFKFSFNMIDSSKLNIGGDICLHLLTNKTYGINVNT